MTPCGPVTSSSGAQFEFSRTLLPISIRPRFSMLGWKNVRAFLPTESHPLNQTRAITLEVSHPGISTSLCRMRYSMRCGYSVDRRFRLPPGSPAAVGGRVPAAYQQFGVEALQAG